MHLAPGGFSYLNIVTCQTSSHAAGAVLDGQSLVAPLESAGLPWVEFIVVVCRQMGSLSSFADTLSSLLVVKLENK